MTLGILVRLPHDSWHSFEVASRLLAFYRGWIFGILCLATWSVSQFCDGSGEERFTKKACFFH